MSTEDNSMNSESGDNAKYTKVAGIVAVLVVVLIVVAISVSKNGNAEGDLGEIAPASSGDQSADAPMIKLGNPTVAVVNGEDIKRSDVFNFISGLPDNVRQMPIQQLFPLALEQVINNRVINTRAQGANLADDPEVQQLLDQAKGQIVRNVFVDRQVTSAITQKRLVEAYEKLLADIGEVQEIKARHILVEDEQKAKELISKLDSGEDFEALAKAESTGPSADRGGDLGYFAKNEMVPEFANAAFSLEVGAHSKNPVQTQFGWHVIKVEEKRTRPEPEFESVKPQLEAQLRQEVLASLLEEWQKDAKIKKFDINGDEIKQN
jgi:peptidyl-prolyl cis-trans isomerase C